MNKKHHPQNRAERLKLRQKDKLKSRKSRPAVVNTDVEAHGEDAYDELYGELLGYQKAKVLYED